MCGFLIFWKKPKIATARLKPWKVPGDLEIWVRDFDKVTDEEKGDVILPLPLKVDRQQLIANVQACG